MIALDVADTTHRAELELGPPVQNGLLRWVSSTLITSADHNSEGGCLRRVVFERVLGRERVTTAAMTAGVGMHKEIETYLATGQLALGPVAMAGRHFIPEPGPGLSVEQPIIVGGNGEIRGVYLRCAGVPVAGHVDLYNHRGEYIDAEGELRRDPPNTLETKDWKSTKDLCWAKTPAQVAATIQMTTYAMAGFRLWPHYEHSRQTHVYFQREGRPQAVLATSRTDRRQIEQRWEYAESVVRRLIDAVRETDPNKVEANTKACRAYNCDCPHLSVCEAGKAAREFNSLDEMFGSRMAERVLNRMKGIPDDDAYSEMEVPLDVFSTLEQDALQGPDSKQSLPAGLLREDEGFARQAQEQDPAGSAPDLLAGVPLGLLRGELGADQVASQGDPPGGDVPVFALPSSEDLDHEVPGDLAAPGRSVRDLSPRVPESPRGLPGPRPLDEFVSLDSVYELQRADRPGPRERGDAGPRDRLSQPAEELVMGLFDVVKTGGAQASVTPITPPEGVGVSISIDDLVAEEAAARASLDPPAPSPLAPTAEFTQAIGVICSAPLGFPKLIGRAAVMFGTLNKHELKVGMEIPAKGKLEKLAPIEDPDAVVALGVEIRKKFPTQGPADVSKMEKAAPRVEHIEPAIAILPPDAPPSNPAIAAVPVEGLDNAKARELAALSGPTDIPGLAESVAAAGVLPAGAAPDLFADMATTTATAGTFAAEKTLDKTPNSAEVTITNQTPAPAAPEQTSVPAVANPAPAGDSAPSAPAQATGTEASGEKPKRGRKPKAKPDATATVTSSNLADKPEGTEVKIWNDTSISIYVDVVAEGEDFQCLDTYVRQLCGTLEAEFKVADVRCASKDSPLGYDKWRGAVDALARRHPPQPGRYVVDTRGNELGEIVAVALKAIALESGGDYVRGAR